MYDACVYPLSRCPTGGSLCDRFVLCSYLHWLVADENGTSLHQMDLRMSPLTVWSLLGLV